MLKKIIGAMLIGVVVVVLVGWKMSENSNLVTTPTGLQYEDIVIGTGSMPQKGQVIAVHYTGTNTKGEQFDSSYGRGTPLKFPFGVGHVISGWDEGLATMRVGGRRKLVIPPDLAYGSRDMGKAIPPHSTLLFDVELVGIE